MEMSVSIKLSYILIINIFPVKNLNVNIRWQHWDMGNRVHKCLAFEWCRRENTAARQQ